ncbi:MAG: hypothetical protein VX278_07165, partial [Myxococcota bacterium]|nr:hypothetical protein [Myxococcota bacterium]
NHPQKISHNAFVFNLYGPVQVLPPKELNQDRRYTVDNSQLLGFFTNIEHKQLTGMMFFEPDAKEGSATYKLTSYMNPWYQGSSLPKPRFLAPKPEDEPTVLCWDNT